jgi:uncharacterized membrane protein (DUF4010 family)
MPVDDLFSRLALALGIGLLIGLERGWKTREAAAGQRTAGIRTFSLVGILGGVCGAIALTFGRESAASGAIFLALSFAAFSGVFAVFCREENRADGTFSATTMVAGVLTFTLGAYALVGDMRAAAAVAVVAAVLLAAREGIHEWVAQLNWVELRAGLMLAAMTFIALPIIPDESIGPLGGVNPREIWIIAIALAGVSFVGYAAVRYFGTRRGILLAAAAGGLVSSTAVTFANARRSQLGEGSNRMLAAGVMVASAVSFVRAMAVIGAINLVVLKIAMPPLFAASVIAAGLAYVLAYRQPVDGEHKEIRLGNPFELKAVVGFAIFLGIIMVVSRFLSERYGATGAVTTAVLTGIADVDAVVISVARLAPQLLSVDFAGFAALAAVATNMISKLAISLVVGRLPFSMAVAAATLATLAAGSAALLAVVRFAGE